jgi:nicotinamide-nucleotide amidase
MTNSFSALVQELGKQCLEHNMFVACAESCTGGWLSHAIVSEAGTSQWFDCGLVTYSNESKQKMLGVEKKTLDFYGAVSKEVAQDMVQGLLQMTGADLTVSITGIAGPDGGSDDKPVGTVWLAWATRKGKMQTAHHVFSGDRTAIREQAVRVALEGLIALQS